MDEQDGPMVRPEELVAAGGACVAAALAAPVTATAEAVRGLDVGDIGEVSGGADPGVGSHGRAGAAAAALADRWEVAVAVWSADLVAHGEALGAAAAAYAAGDGDAAAFLGAW